MGSLLLVAGIGKRGRELENTCHISIMPNMHQMKYKPELSKKKKGKKGRPKIDVPGTRTLNLSLRRTTRYHCASTPEQ